MSLLLAIILGAVIGWIAASLTGREEGVFGSMVIGVVGAFIGGFLSNIIMGSSKTYLGLSWSGLLWTLIGALIFSALLNTFRRKRTNN